MNQQSLLSMVEFSVPSLHVLDLILTGEVNLLWNVRGHHKEGSITTKDHDNSRLEKRTSYTDCMIFIGTLIITEVETYILLGNSQGC